MTDKPQITTIDEAKAALDEDISSLQGTVDFYQRRVDEEKLNLRRYEETLWRLKAIRRRMDPPAQPELVARTEAA